MNNLTQKEMKTMARAFQLMMKGEIYGMESIWKRVNEIQQLTDLKKFQLIIKCACNDAMELARELENK